MIPPVKKEPASMVAIAPTPGASQQLPVAPQRWRQDGGNQAAPALEVTQQPPETWYKDQFGRKATFELSVKRTEASCAQCLEQRLLVVQLLYESGKPVEKHDILHVMSGQCLDKSGQSTLAIRIAEVSKNHLNQRFRVQIAVPTCPGSCGYKTSVVSGPVLVLSKKKKRPVKRNAETESTVKPKKAKHASVQEIPKRKMSSDSTPDSSQSSSTVTGNVTAAIAEMEEAIPPRTSGSTAPFTPDTPNLCLWANAAFDLLYKLQWQRIPGGATDKPGANLDEILAHALSKAYKCPSCQEAYGQVPTHRDDCDLKLLLEQGGQTEVPAARKSGNDFTAQHSLQWSSDKQLEWPDRPKAMYSGGDLTPKLQTSPYRLSQDLVLSGPESKDGQGSANAPTNDFGSAANWNVTSWKEYASISKLLYSTSYLDGKSPQAGTGFSPRLKWTGVLPPVGTLSPGFPSLPSAAKNSATQQGEQQSASSQRFSALLAVTQDISADTADLLREGEVALQGGGNIVNSLNSMSLSDFLRPNATDSPGNDAQLAHKPISVSLLLQGDQPTQDMSSEKGVQIIMASDFRGCGFPALDASFNQLGFYHLLTETHDSPAELRFAPSLFPLPEEMLQELGSTVAEWKHNPEICYRRDPSECYSEDSLTRLKIAVLHQVTR